MADPLKPSSSITLHRATVACQSCRLRKVKCDAQSVAAADQRCTPCRRAGQECLLDPLSDGRRSVSRKFVDKLQQRIETLEALNQRSQDYWPTNENSHMPLADSCPVPSGGQSTVSTKRIDSRPPQDTAGDAALSSHHTLPASSTATRASPETGRDDSHTFYGATSHPHVTSPSKVHEECPVGPLDDADSVRIDIDPRSPHLRDHLFQSFFKYQMLWVDIVNRESFLEYKKIGDSSRWYSKFLENAMLACGSRLSTSRSVRALGSRYCELAKDEALGAMSDPTPANMQGFLLLSEYEVSQGNDRPGWMFCGVACRMLSDLGLHKLSTFVGAPDRTPEQTRESALAFALLSACIVYDGVWTLYLGRPSSIPTSVLNIAGLRCSERRKSDSPWLNAWIGLCLPMAEVCQLLNEQSTGNSEHPSQLRNLLRQMEQWYENLPAELAYNENRLIGMDLAGYGLHAQYCKVQILVRRALAEPNTRKRQFSQISCNGEFQDSSGDSATAIYQYAFRTARLVVTFREAFGMERIPSIMLDNAVVAATAMMRYFKKSNPEKLRQHTIWLRQLVKSLESVRPHFPVVGRMLESLNHISSRGLSCGTVSPARQSSIEAPIIEFPTSSQALDLGTRDLGSRFDPSHDSAITTVDGPDNLWDCFNADIASAFFASDGFSESVLNLPSSSELVIPNSTE